MYGVLFESGLVNNVCGTDLDINNHKRAWEQAGGKEIYMTPLKDQSKFYPFYLVINRMKRTKERQFSSLSEALAYIKNKDDEFSIYVFNHEVNSKYVGSMR